MNEKNIKTLEESVITAMDATDKEIFPYLSYILQDIWELGTNPNLIVKIIKNYFRNYSNLKILDLGCGKGAVSINISKELGCNCYGIDGISDFITFAKQKAVEFKVENLCNFDTGDIREKINELFDFDIIILGATGPVFGDYFATLTLLSKCVKETGLIIIDDGYIDDTSDFVHPSMFKKSDILQQSEKANMKIIEIYTENTENIETSNDFIYESIKKRCYELIEKYPDKEKLFFDYIKNQEEENDILENKIICSTMVIKRGKNE